MKKIVNTASNRINVYIYSYEFNFVFRKLLRVDQIVRERQTTFQFKYSIIKVLNGFPETTRNNKTINIRVNIISTALFLRIESTFSKALIVL